MGENRGITRDLISPRLRSQHVSGGRSIHEQVLPARSWREVLQLKILESGGETPRLALILTFVRGRGDCGRESQVKFIPEIIFSFCSPILLYYFCHDRRLVWASRCMGRALQKVQLHHQLPRH